MGVERTVMATEPEEPLEVKIPQILASNNSNKTLAEMF